MSQYILFARRNYNGQSGLKSSTEKIAFLTEMVLVVE